MANMCSGYVKLSGGNITGLLEDLQAATAGIDVELARNLGVDIAKSIGCVAEEQYYFDVVTPFVLEDDSIVIEFWTKWDAKPKQFVCIADRYDVSFAYHYEELGNLIYGVCVYKDGVLTDYCVSSSEINSVLDATEEGGDTDYESLEALVEQKINSSSGVVISLSEVA
jgi:hypothetical protein